MERGKGSKTLLVIDYSTDWTKVFKNVHLKNGESVRVEQCEWCAQAFCKRCWAEVPKFLSPTLRLGNIHLQFYLLLISAVLYVCLILTVYSCRDLGRISTSKPRAYFCSDTFV
jgi:hypothetical protein